MALVLWQFWVCLVINTIISLYQMYKLLTHSILFSSGTTAYFHDFPFSHHVTMGKSHAHIICECYDYLCFVLSTSPFTPNMTQNGGLCMPHNWGFQYGKVTWCKSLMCQNIPSSDFCMEWPHHLFILCAGKLCYTCCNDSGSEGFIHIQYLISHLSWGAATWLSVSVVALWPTQCWVCRIASSTIVSQCHFLLTSLYCAPPCTFPADLTLDLWKVACGLHTGCLSLDFIGSASMLHPRCHLTTNLYPWNHGGACGLQLCWALIV